MRVRRTRGAHARPTRARGRRLALPLLAVLAVLLPTAAVANHGFTDVPSSAFYHSDVDQMKRAGITGGCGGTNYCPDQAVTRGQMATFMNRGIGRVAQDASGGAFDIPGDFTPAVLEDETILVPGASGGVQYVKADAWVKMDSLPTGCPCDFGLQLVNTADGASSPTVVGQGTAGPGGDIDETYHLQWVFEVPAGTSPVIDLRGFLSNATGTRAASYNVAEAVLILTTIPTSADGVLGALSEKDRPRDDG